MPTLLERIEKGGERVDVLVDNAVLMEMGALDEIPSERIERLLELNVVVPTKLTRGLLPGMIERGRGRVLNVASVSAFQPIPILGLHATSKSFVLSLSESLSEQLRGTGVTVTALCPGFTRTDMLDQAQELDPSARHIPGFMISDVHEMASEGPVDAGPTGSRPPAIRRTRRRNSATDYDPSWPPPPTSSVMERLAFWRGAVAMWLAFSITLPLVVIYARRIRRPGRMGWVSHRD